MVSNYANGTWSKMDSFVYFGGAEELRKRSDLIGFDRLGGLLGRAGAAVATGATIPAPKRTATKKSAAKKATAKKAATKKAGTKKAAEKAAPKKATTRRAAKKTTSKR